MSDISQYYLHDREKAEPLHRLVVRYKDGFLENHALQDVLLNEGLPLNPEKRPKSYFDVHDAVWNRSLVAVNLEFLKYTIDLATKPQFVAIERKPKIIISGAEESLELKTSQGLDAASVEALQQGWFGNPQITEKVRELKSALSKAFDEFNLKFILGRMYYARHHNRLWVVEQFEAALKIFEKMNKTWDDRAYSDLDSAYYLAGNGLTKTASPIWEELSKSEYGKMFLLSVKETRKGITAFKKISIEKETK